MKKSGFRVALKSTETRKSQLCPLHIGRALAKSYSNLFYTPKSLPYCRKNFANSLAAWLCRQKKILLVALLSEENFANSKK